MLSVCATLERFVNLVERDKQEPPALVETLPLPSPVTSVKPGGSIRLDEPGRIPFTLLKGTYIVVSHLFCLSKV